jgi:hypothetical protein
MPHDTAFASPPSYAEPILKKMIHTQYISMEKTVFFPPVSCGAYRLICFLPGIPEKMGDVPNLTL